MEFWHYFNSTPASGLTVRTPFIAYNGALSDGNFTSNTGGDNTIYEIENSEFDENFTAICTFNKNLSNPQIFLSKYNAAGGFTLGITAGNLFYIDAHTPVTETHIYKDINLGVKNCVVIKKAGQSFSLYKYDLLSRAFESTESFAFSPSTQLLGTSETIIAGVSSFYPYKPHYGNNSIGFFNGTIEQFAYMSGAVEDAYLLPILSGFLPLTKTPSLSSAFTKLDESYRSPEGYYAANHSAFDAYFSGINNPILTGYLGTGKWFGTGYGSVGAGGLTGTISYATGINSCYGTGVYYTMTYTGTGIAPATTFSDVIRVVKGDLTTISHNLTLSRTGISNFHIDYDASYSLVITTGSTFVSNDSYYTGFKMDGIVSENTSRIALATDTGVAPTGYNILGYYDNLQGLFTVPNFSPGALYYNGLKYTSNYIITGVYVDISGSTEISTDTMVGDNSSGSTFLNSGLSNWATGKFYPNASMVYSGTFPTGRMLKADYLETSSHHLYHQSPIQSEGTTFLFQL